jgi:2-oxoglutarate ferredoxin oxidoreductase subunit delta
VVNIVIHQEKCKGCLFCVSACKKGVLIPGTSPNKKGYHYIKAEKPENCIGCKMCSIICPDAAIELFKEDD